MAVDSEIRVRDRKKVLTLTDRQKTSIVNGREEKSRITPVVLINHKFIFVDRVDHLIAVLYGIIN